MTMHHKAFVFNHQDFHDELRGFLDDALKTGRVDQLADYIDNNIVSLKDPCEGGHLDASWENLMEAKDVHEYGDFAITKFYNPQNDIGLGYDWGKIQHILKSKNLDEMIVLGAAFGPGPDYFDPGKLGSYFQSADEVGKNLRHVNQLIEMIPNIAEELGDLINMLEQAFKAKKGLYITF